MGTKPGFFRYLALALFSTVAADPAAWAGSWSFPSYFLSPLVKCVDKLDKSTGGVGPWDRLAGRDCILDSIPDSQPGLKKCLLDANFVNREDSAIFSASDAESCVENFHQELDAKGCWDLAFAVIYETSLGTMTSIFDLRGQQAALYVPPLNHLRGVCLHDFSFSSLTAKQCEQIAEDEVGGFKPNAYDYDPEPAPDGTMLAPLYDGVLGKCIDAHLPDWNQDECMWLAGNTVDSDTRSANELKCWQMSFAQFSKEEQNYRSMIGKIQDELAPLKQEIDAIAPLGSPAAAPSGAAGAVPAR